MAALSEQLRRSADHHRRPACRFAGNREAVTPIPAAVPLPAGRAAGFEPDARDGGSARFRNTRGGSHASPGLRVEPVLASEQEILDAVDSYYGETDRTPTRAISTATVARLPRISSIFATWRARRRSSAW